MQNIPVPLFKKGERKAFGFLHEGVCITGGPYDAKTYFLVPQDAETSPGSRHGVEECL